MKSYPMDDRKFTILDKSQNDEYHSIRNNETLFFDSFFQRSSCEGTLAADEKSVKFDNIFANQECMPKCRTVDGDDGTLTELCE